MPGPSWWPFDHERRPCDCAPQPVPVTVELRDSAGNVRDVRASEFFVRPHRHHRGWHDEGAGH